MNCRIRVYLTVFLTFILSFSYANTKLIGYVIDAQTKEPLSFVSISVNNSQMEFSDDEGFFDIDLPNSVDSVIFSYLGYKDFSLKKKQLKKDTIEIKLEPEGYMLQEFVVKAKRRVKEKDTIAIRIFRNVIKHKSDNKPKAYDTYQYEEYVKTVASLFNISEKITQRKIFKPFRFIFENQDTTENGERVIPLILKETISDFYKKGNKTRTVVKASKVSGIEQLRFSELLDVAYDNVDAYSDQTTVSGKVFVMPFAPGALTLYNFYFIDSVKTADSLWNYQLAFVPKSKSDMLFVGRAWIQDSSFAIKRIEISIDKRSNINFVNDFILKQTYYESKNVGWFLEKEERATNIAFTKRKKAKSVRLYRYVSRNDIQLNQPINDTLLGLPDPLLLKDYRRKTDSFWVAERHDTLTTVENNVYFLIDSLKNTKTFKRLMKTGEFFTSGFYRINKVQIGDYMRMFSWNDVEGLRLRLDFKSNWRMSEWVQFNTHIAYGTRDKKVKYGLAIEAKLPDKKQILHYLGASYNDDYQKFTIEANNLDYDHIINTLTRKRNIPDLVYVREAKVYYNRNIFKNSFKVEFNFNYKRFFSIPNKVEFNKTINDSTKIYRNSFKVFTPQFVFSGTPGAKMIKTAKRQVFLKGKLPRFTLTYTPSFSKLLSDFNFHKLDLLVEEKLPTPIGRTFMRLQGSILFGKAPYPILYLLPGNQSPVLEYKNFNMMKEGQYFTDRYVYFFLEHHFDGFFFNKIPGWKKLGFREVFFTKLAYSFLDKNKFDFSDIPPNIKGLNGFYAEIGFGIESIAKFLRIDFNWRLTQRDDPTNKKFRVTFTFNPGT